jgi:hypothetical protein
VWGRNVLLGAGAIAVVLWCGAVSGYHRGSSGAIATWVVSLVAVVAVDVSFWRGRSGTRWGWRLEPARNPWPRPGRGGAAHALVGIAPWLVLVAVAAAWDVLGIDTGTHEAHLTISALSQAFRPLNALLLVVWMSVGIGYGAARARAPVAAVPPASPHGDVAPRWALAVVPTASRPALLLPSSRPLGVAFWLSVLVAALVIDLVARRGDGRWATAEEFARFVSTSPVARVALVVAWTFAGYHLFAR